MKNHVFYLLALTLTACSPDGLATEKPAGQLAFNDFEAVDGWASGTPIPSLTQEKAHSGTYAIKIAPGIDYSLGYNNLLGKMGDGKARKIRVQAWVFLPNPRATPLLVTQIRNDGDPKDLLWEGQDLAKEATGVNKWVLVDKTITLPASATYSSRLLVYLWRRESTQPTYLDDLRLSRAD